MQLFIRIVNRLSTLCGVLAVILIAVSILIVCQMVVLRYGFSASTSWQTDVVTFALVAATMLGCPYLLLTGGHVKVDIVVSKLSVNKQRLFKIISRLIVMMVGIAFAWTGTQLTFEAYHGGWLSETVAEIPLWIAYLAMPVGFSLLAIQALADILQTFLGLDTDVNPPSTGHG